MTKQEYLITTLSNAPAQTLEQARYKAELLLEAVEALELDLKHAQELANGNDHD